MRWAALVRLARELPGVEEGVWYRTPGLHVCGRFFARLREDGWSAVFRLETVDEQEFLVQSRADVYFITDHYRGYPAVLARLAALDIPECRRRLELAWRLRAPRSLLHDYGATAPPTGEKGRRNGGVARRSGVSPAASARRPRRPPRRRPVRPRPSGGR